MRQWFGAVAVGFLVLRAPLASAGGPPESPASKSAPAVVPFVRLDFGTLLARYVAADRRGRNVIQQVLFASPLFSAEEIATLLKGAEAWRHQAMLGFDGSATNREFPMPEAEELEALLRASGGTKKEANPFDQERPRAPEIPWEMTRP